MGKKYILNERQFMTAMKLLVKENVDTSNMLQFNDIENLLHAVIDNDFKGYTDNGSFVCNSLEDKGSILRDICLNAPFFTEDGKIEIYSSVDKKYYTIDNLLA